MPRRRKRFKKWKTCRMLLKKEARFYDGEWKDEREEPCGSPLTHEVEQMTSLCDLCRHGGQALLGAVALETPDQVAARAQTVGGAS